MFLTISYKMIHILNLFNNYFLPGSCKGKFLPHSNLNKLQRHGMCIVVQNEFVLQPSLKIHFSHPYPREAAQVAFGALFATATSPVRLLWWFQTLSTWCVTNGGATAPRNSETNQVSQKSLLLMNTVWNWHLCTWMFFWNTLRQITQGQ